MFLLRVLKALKARKVPHAVAGGYAVALHGAVRGTLDVDVVIRMSERHFRETAKALESLGLASRLPVTATDVYRFRDEYMKNRNMVAWSFLNPDNPAEIVDVLLTHDLDELETETLRFQGQTIPVLSLESLILMKSGTGRDQDKADVKALRLLRKEDR